MNAEANVADPSEYHLQPISDGWPVLVLPPSSEPQARFCFNGAMGATEHASAWTCTLHLLDGMATEG